jgi:ADP-ribose pyrophosphatase
VKDWTRIEPTSAQKVGWRTIVSKTFTVPNGDEATFETYDKENTHYAGIVALTADKQVIIAYQFRPGPEKMFYEIPGGGVDADEDFEAAAVRELAEETGYLPGEVKSLGLAYKNAYDNATYHYYLATNCHRGDAGQQLSENEFVDVKLISIDECIAKAKTGKMTDGEAIFLALDDLRKIAQS